MAVTNFSTKNDTFRKLLGNGLSYRIPRFQRDYSWTETEWEDLWLDIQGTLTGTEPAHYMGYLVLQSDNDKSFDVIDGQQRLTTLSLIVLAVIRNLEALVQAGKEAESNKRRADQIRQTYIGYLDPVTLISRSKLSLNRNNDHYYQTYVVPGVPLPQRGFRASEHLLRKAYQWFEKKIRDSSRGPDEGVQLAKFVEDMSDKLFFTVITVTDELNAYKVFETLNSRGVRLSSTDLLKNYLFSVLHRQDEHENEIKNLEERWEAMVGRLGSESFPDFLRVHWNSRRSFVRQTELFKIIRGKISTREQVFALLREMESDVDTYMSLTQPESSHWPESLKKFARQLRMFHVRQPYPLLLAARRVFSDSDFESILRGCSTITFRYNVIGGQHTGEQERQYNHAAEEVSTNRINTTRGVLDALKPLYPSDEAFIATFTEKTFPTSSSRNVKIVRYILCALEKHVSGKEFDPQAESLSLEHVLPQSPKSGWESFSNEEVEAIAHRIGNLTLLKTSDNRDLGNVDFAAKRSVYETSEFALTQKLAEDAREWNPERLAARQRWMATQAAAIWRVGF
jgi:Protein of unknown function DUF262/Protein of unknown function (DUF1524)